MLSIQELKLDELTPYENNAKIHTDKDIDVIVESIKEFGMNDPIGIWGEKNIIVEGHGRLLALKKLGYETVPCIRLDHLTDEQRRMYTLTHNKSAELSEWDFEKLEQEMKQLEFELSNFGFDEKELMVEFNKNKETEEDDFDVEENLPEEPTTRRGQLYKLGNHYLMCGDSTNKNDVEKLMQGNKADLVFTDPPYNVAIGDKNAMLNTFQKAGRCTENIKNDSGMTDEECGQKLWKPAFTNMFDFAKDDCSLYVTMPQGGTHMMMMMMMIYESNWQVKHELMWLKNSPTFSMGRLNYDYQHEPILFGWKKKHNWYGAGKFNKSVWQIDKPKKCNLHPTMKPIELIENALLNSSKESDIVLDLFGGSGTTLIACEQLNRQCYTMELDEKYCDVIIQRWETLTGLKAELIF